MTTFVADGVHVPSLLGVKVFGVGMISDTFFTEVLRMFYEIAEGLFRYRG